MTTDVTAAYRLFRHRGRPVSATPVDAPRAVRRHGAARIVGFTPKRRWLRRGLMLGSTLGVDRFFSSSLKWGGRPELAGFDDLLSVLRGDERLREWEYAYVLWLSEPHRGRIYLHLMDETAESVAFVKAAPADTSGAFERERAALTRLAGGPNGLFRTPAVLSSETASGAGPAWLALEAMPGFLEPFAADPHDAEKLVSQYLLQDAWAVPKDELASLAWWRTVKEAAPSAFVDDVLAMAEDPVRVGWVHGDFGPHNLGSANGMPWVFDWESSRPDGPVGTDFWSLEFLDSGPTEVIRRARRARPAVLGDILLAVAYQAGLALRHGPETVQRWATIRKDIGL